MAVFNVDDDVLHSPAAKEYYARADSRVMIGLRFTLETLGIPVPEYAQRKPAGRPPSKAVAAAFAADNPTSYRPKPAHSDPLGERRLGQAVAKAHARKAQRQGAITNPHR